MNRDPFPIADENLQGARLALDNSLLRVAASRAYYAVYAAMWAYLGDPPRGKWGHGGIAAVFLQRFRADLAEKNLTPHGYRTTRKKLEDLYMQRLKADYDVEPMDRNEVVLAVGLSEWLVSLIQRRCRS